MFCLDCWSAESRYLDLDPERIAQIAEMLPEKPQGMGPAITDRAAFAMLQGMSIYTGIVAEAEALLTQDFPEWNDEAYLECSRTGLRPGGEKMMYRRRVWLQPLVLAECFENNGRFVPAIEMVLREFCRQKAWTLPAHDRNLSNFNGTDYTVDLSSALWTFNMAQALYMLGDKLSNEVRQEVLDTMHERMFDPVLDSLKTGRNIRGNHFWLKTENNWNAVCLAGVSGAALTALPSREERAVFAAMAEHYSPNYLKGYSDDGYCTEGLGYYNYGFENYILMREMLWHATAGKIDLFADPKVRKIALFGPNIEIINGVCPLIADCKINVRVDEKILWYCNRALGLGLSGCEKLQLPRPFWLYGNGVYLFPGSTAQKAKAEYSVDRLRSRFDESGVLICRPSAGGKLGVCLKGGNNAEHHNHNDVGSFTVALGTERPVGDPGGVNAYNGDMFGPERYTKYQTFRSLSHPVPFVAGREQRFGLDAAAKVLHEEISDLQDEMKLDLRAAYDVPGLKKLERTFVFSRVGDGSLTVTDAFEFSKPQDFAVVLTTHGTWKQIDSSTLEFSSGDETVTASFSAPGELEFKSEDISENGLNFTRVIASLKAPQQNGTVEVVFAP